jgi:hypothetical protein
LVLNGGGLVCRYYFKVNFISEVETHNALHGNGIDVGLQGQRLIHLVNVQLKVRELVLMRLDFYLIADIVRISKVISSVGTNICCAIGWLNDHIEFIDLLGSARRHLTQLHTQLISACLLISVW